MSNLKVHKTVQEQVNLLREKGFVIGDESACEEFLRIVNYYRFSAYYLPLSRYENPGQKTYCECFVRCF